MENWSNNTVFISKGIIEECVMHMKSDNIEIMIYYKASKVIKERFGSLVKKYQTTLETWKVVFLHFVVLRNKSGSQWIINRLSWLEKIKKKKETINSINDDDKCFQ